ncbi:hypothetical protein H0H92_006445, partial [Tricholoma furcatifolium]
MSSDVASARFFASPGYKQSAHSSISSIFDDPSPPLLLLPTVAKHIVPPKELPADQAQSHVPGIPSLSSLEKMSNKSDDYNRASEPATELASLPLPPRRLGQPLGWMSRDTYTLTFADASFAPEKHQEHTEKMDDTVVKEVEGDNDGMSGVTREWEHLWGVLGNLESRDRKDDEVDSRSGSPI